MSDYFITSYVSPYTVSLYKNSYGVSSTAIDNLFSSTYAFSQDNLDSLAGTILGKGIDFFQDEKYTEAASYFKSAAAFSPGSDNAASAYDYLGQAYIKLEDNDKAIKTYEEAIKLFPTSDEFFTALGDLYMTDGRTADAIDIYEKGIAINPNDAESHYSLGQCYLTSGYYSKAQEQFKDVIRVSPSNASGYYGLGQVARAEGDYSQAVTQLTKAIGKDRDFELAYVELGYTYADQGDFTNAQYQLDILNDKASDYVTDVENYITQVTQPEITSVTSTNGFDTTLEAGTSVASLSPGSLTSANSTKLFSLKFTFSKEMDVNSIINPYDWKISRAAILDNGGIYNNGLTIPDTEASITSVPAYVTYDADSQTATVNFRVKQNADGDATIDPEHIVFKFYGYDTYGKAMDKSADEYSGFSSIA